MINPQLTSTNTFTVIVREVNVAPSLPTISTQIVNELTLLSVTNSATNANIHSTITGYTLVSPPSNMVVSASGIITWTPAQAQSPGTNLITTIVTNSNPYDLINPRLTSTNTFTVIVREVNVAPTLPTVSTQIVNELTLLTVTNSATNANIHATITGYTLVNPPSNMVVSASGIITWTPAQAQSPSTNLITTIVTNSDAFDLVNPTLTATNTFTVIVKEMNVAPTLPVIPTDTINELTLLTVTNTATNANIHATITGYTLVNPPSNMVVSASGIITWTPAQAQSPSTNLITTIVTNSDAFDLVNPVLTATNTFTVIVREVNVAPALPTISTQIVNELTLMTVTNTATNANIHAAITGYRLVSPPSNMVVSASGVITWTPVQAQSPSTNLITTIVTNSDAFDLVNPVLTSTNSFTVIVKEVNVAPSLPTISTQIVNELTLLTVTNTATNANIHATITGYTLVSPPSNMVVSASGVITWTPAQAQSPSTNLITTIVTNSDAFDLVNPTLTSTNTFTVIVREVNVVPTLPTISTQIVNELTLMTVTNTATNSNIHAITSYTLVSPPSNMVVSASGIITWTPAQAQSPGTNLITTIVTNSDAFDLVNPILTATNTFTVIVREVNIAPVLSNISTQVVNVNTLLTVTNTAVETNIHATVGYTLTTFPTGMIINSNGIITWTPNPTQSPSTNQGSTVATNTDLLDTVNPHLSASNTFYVVVSESNIAPAFVSIIATQTVNELTLLTVTNAATNANIHATIFGYGLINPPAGAAISTNGVFRLDAAANQQPVHQPHHHGRHRHRFAGRGQSAFDRDQHLHRHRQGSEHGTDVTGGGDQHRQRTDIADFHQCGHRIEHPFHARLSAGRRANRHEHQHQQHGHLDAEPAPKSRHEHHHDHRDQQQPV